MVLQQTNAKSKPSMARLKMGKHVSRYLKGHQELNIAYKSGYFKLQAFANASFANDPDKGLSTRDSFFIDEVTVSVDDDTGK